MDILSTESQNSNPQMVESSRTMRWQCLHTACRNAMYARCKPHLIMAPLLVRGAMMQYHMYRRRLVLDLLVTSVEVVEGVLADIKKL